MRRSAAAPEASCGKPGRARQQRQAAGTDAASPASSLLARKRALAPSSSTSPRARRSYSAAFFSSAARDSLSRSVVVLGERARGKEQHAGRGWACQSARQRRG